jgi:pimeloyl-ACP methyl ester carboxylesterase
MPSVERSGVVIRYEVDGDGFPLVLLHGLSVDAASWRRAAYSRSAPRSGSPWRRGTPDGCAPF